MVRNYKKKETGSRTSCTSSPAMIAAYNSVMSAQMSSYQAAKHYGVDKKSLLRRVRNEIPIQAHPGRQSVLSPVQEQELAECLLLLAEWGWGFSKEEVKDIIQEFLNDNDIENPFTENRPGRDWFDAFLKRHPEVVPRKTEHLSNSRAKAEDPAVITHWFSLLDKVLQEKGVKGLPEQIFNCNESGFVTDPKSQTVLARRGSNRVNQCIGGSGREQITVNCCISASGSVLPPYIVYKGKNLYLDWTQGGPSGTAFTTSEKGWMEGPQFLDWFKTIFLKNTEHLSSKPRVLIFDGHLSHISLPLVVETRSNNVSLLRLPSHLTHLLQPLDTSVFRPVKSKWQSLLLKYARTHSGPVSKKHFPEMISKLFNLAFTQEQVKGGFRGTGIFPFNDKAIDTSTFSQHPQLAACATELTPASSSSPAVQISLTVQDPDSDTPPCSMAASSSSSDNLASLTSRPSTPPDAGMSPSPSASASSSRPSTPPSGNSSIKDYFLKQLVLCI